LELWHYPLLVVIGAVAGFLNVMAGGGSLLTMPALIFLGMPPALANGTNRVALVAQNITAITAFRRKGFSDFQLSLTLGFCTLPGAIAGAIVAVRIDPLWFKRLLAAVMVGVLLQMLLKQRAKKRTGTVTGAPDTGQESETASPRHTLWAHLGMVGVGFYGGFIQAGVGFILMAILHNLLKLGLVRVNMHKVFIVFTYMVPSLMVFALQDQVRWDAGLILAVGTAGGAWAATRLQIARGEGIVRAIFAVAVLAMAVKLAIG